MRPSQVAYDFKHSDIAIDSSLNSDTTQITVDPLPRQVKVILLNTKYHKWFCLWYIYVEKSQEWGK